MGSAIKHIDAFIAPSLTSQRKHEPMGLHGRIVHIPNFVSIAETGTAQENAVRPEKPYFLFVGRLEKLKGLHTLLPVFQSYDKAELWIAGTGSEEAHLRGVALGNPNIRFLGHRSDAELQRLYREATAVIYPAVNFQVGVGPTGGGHGAPLVIMESFSQQTPVIVSNVGRIPAIIEQSGGGAVYSTEAELIVAMDRLLCDPAHRRELGLRAYDEYRHKWTPDAYLARYFALIDDIRACRGVGPTRADVA
jgi:glycosyltransferase involved in cell wall biosynthesis